MTLPPAQNRWDETLSQEFIDYGRYFIPEREDQIEIIIRLLPEVDVPATVLELCCGEGLLAEAILERTPHWRVIGYDGSPHMLQKASARLARFGMRFEARLFDLGEAAWRVMEDQPQAVVTSLAVHHLPGPEKAKLYADMQAVLAPGGAFLIADILDPAHPQAKKLAAEAYDQVVRVRSLALEGDTRAFDFFQREGWNIFRYLDPEDIDKPSPLYAQLKWLEQAGFEGIDVFWMQAGHAVFGGWKPVP
ncbi:MAG: class I SAM-dependent methyltransferase [Anaerolineales bacterium]|nr:class I SAM-dependent methyltransferase [Anaerolineales bacterium]